MCLKHHGGVEGAALGDRAQLLERTVVGDDAHAVGDARGLVCLIDTQRRVGAVGGEAGRPRLPISESTRKRQR